MENENGTNGIGRTAVVFLIGAMAGGITALLLAPRTGAQVRGRFKRGARDLRDRESHVAHAAGEKAATMKGAASAARVAYRDEMQRRRAASRAAAAAKGVQP